jgi:DNA mismatch repair ATPase MutS
MKKGDLYQLATKISLEKLLLFHEAINQKNTFEQELKQKALELDIFNKKLSPWLSGKEILLLEEKLNFKLPSRSQLSVILKKGYNKQCYGKFNSYDEALAWLEQYLLTQKAFYTNES